MTFSWTKALGLGLVLALAMFAIVSIFMGFAVFDSAIVKIITVALAGIIAFSLSYWLSTKDNVDAFLYGFVFAAVALAMDYFVTRHFAEEIFKSAHVWVGYALIFFAPWVQRSFSLPEQAHSPPIH